MEEIKEKPYPTFQTEMLTDVMKGIYTITIYYSDGSIVVEKIPKGRPVIVEPLNFY